MTLRNMSQVPPAHSMALKTLLAWRSLFDLLDFTPAQVLVNAITGRNKPRRLIRIAVEMLVYGINRDENQIALFPVKALGLRGRLPLEALLQVKLDVPVERISAALEDIHQFFSHVAVLS